MAGTNDFLLFAEAGGANVIDQATYLALSQRTTGFATGTAQSNQLNKVWRQSAFVATCIGQIIANNNVNAVDNGDTATFIANFLAAIAVSPALTGNPTAPTQTAGNNSTRLANTAFVQTTLGSYYTATQVAANFATIAQVNTAQATANTANNVATNALNSAASAVSIANAAQNTATTAINTALGRVGQLYSGNIGGSRAFNTVYTNTDSNPRFICACFNSVNGARQPVGYVNGRDASTDVAVSSNSLAFIVLIVPSGQTYHIDTPGFLTISAWYEFS